LRLSGYFLHNKIFILYFDLSTPEILPQIICHGSDHFITASNNTITVDIFINVLLQLLINILGFYTLNI